MSNIIHKVKDAVTHHGDSKDHKSTGTSDANTYDSTRSSNYGPHDTNTGNTVDPRVDSDRSSYGNPGVAGSTGAYGTTGHTGTTGNYGTTHSSTGPTTGDAYDLNRSTNHGPHDSNIANKADPRIDSDRDGRASYGSTGVGSTGGAYGSTGSTGYPSTTHTSTQPLSTGAGSTGAYGTTGHTGSTGGYGTTGSTGPTAGDAYDLNRSTNHGHHDSNIANKADPRIDSDRDGRASYGSTGVGSTGGAYGSTGAAGTTGTTGSYNTVPSTHSGATGPASSTAGPHSSNVANEADPRVDSDQSKKKKEHLDGEYSGINRFDKDVHKGSIAGGNQVIGLHGSKGPTTTKNFDQSQHESTGAGSSYNTGGSTTAGPHKSDTLNKLDPRVDSDLDGSKTVGGNQTGAQTQRY